MAAFGYIIYQPRDLMGPTLAGAGLHASTVVTRVERGDDGWDRVWYERSDGVSIVTWSNLIRSERDTRLAAIVRAHRPRYAAFKLWPSPKERVLTTAEKLVCEARARRPRPARARMALLPAEAQVLRWPSRLKSFKR